MADEIGSGFSRRSIGTYQHQASASWAFVGSTSNSHVDVLALCFHIFKLTTRQSGEHGVYISKACFNEDLLHRLLTTTAFMMFL